MSNAGIEIIIRNYNNLLQTSIDCKTPFKYIDYILKDYPSDLTSNELNDLMLDQYSYYMSTIKNNYKSKIMAMQDATYYALASYEQYHNVDFIKKEQPPHLGFKYGDNK